ncbi:Spy/CpxP family protein refolding chaperone [bacterium]|nr:Spy/CpxP family protein refolding chaperone [bacterium]
MKRASFNILFSALFLAAAVVSAQKIEKKIVIREGRGMHQCCSENLTEEQQHKIQELKTALEKQIMPIQADIEIKQAELQKMLIADKPDAGAVDRKIDEIGMLRLQVHKMKVQNQLKIRALLTPEQRLEFDKCRGCGKGGGACEGMGMGSGCGMGMRPGRGMGRGDRLMLWHERGDADAPCAAPCKSADEKEVEVKVEKK